MRIQMADNFSLRQTLFHPRFIASGSTCVYMCNSERHSILMLPSCQNDTCLRNNSLPCIINYGTSRLVPLTYTFLAGVLLLNVSTSGNRVFVALVEQVSLLPHILINYLKATACFTALGEEQIRTSGFHRYRGTNISEHSFLTFYQCGIEVSRDQTPPGLPALLSFQSREPHARCSAVIEALRYEF